MTKEELKQEEKDKYSTFIADISEILGLGKPVDILKLCMTTDRFFKPYQNRIAELEKQIAELKEKCETIEDRLNEGIIYRKVKDYDGVATSLLEQKHLVTKAKEIIKDYMIIVKGDHTTVCSVPEENRCINVLKLNEQAEQFLKDQEEEA